MTPVRQRMLEDMVRRSGRTDVEPLVERLHPPTVSSPWNSVNPLSSRPDGPVA
jgi:hypothetical protein